MKKKKGKSDFSKQQLKKGNEAVCKVCEQGNMVKWQTRNGMYMAWTQAFTYVESTYARGTNVRACKYVQGGTYARGLHVW